MFAGSSKICEKLRGGVQQLMNKGIFMVKQSSDEGHMATLEIPYNPLQILVSSSPVAPLIIPNQWYL